jgi:ASC-1-like (ASCH) protein
MHTNGIKDAQRRRLKRGVTIVILGEELVVVAVLHERKKINVRVAREHRWLHAIGSKGKQMKK